MIPGGGGHGADLFTPGDLVQQVWQDRTVAVAAGGKLHRPDVRSGRIHGQMDLAPPLGDASIACRAMIGGGPARRACAPAIHRHRGTLSRYCPPEG
jgi:hypothetical protein